MPAGGMTEWRGWCVTNHAWWTQIASDQERSLFTKGVGAVAVADPDEWDDQTHAPGTFNSSMTTSPISLTNAAAGSLRLYFDSSWRAEGNQAAAIEARFDGGAPVPVASWTSVAGTRLKPDAVNETLMYQVANPAGAHSVTFTFKLFDAGNNWWWAIDNLLVTARALHPRRVLLNENFESVPLGPNVDEIVVADRVWSGSPPAGWTFDDSGVFGINNPALGMTEWKGWAITDRTWWSTIAADQGRSGFTRASGAVAVADPDEWDDKGSPSSQGSFNAKMLTKPVSLDGVNAGSLQIAFDSSWRHEGVQKAALTAVFDTGERVSVLKWDSAAGPTFKPDAPNEHVEFSVNNPAGAHSVVFEFNLYDARNNWWWAIDNLKVTGEERLCTADFNGDASVDFFDYLDFVDAFSTGAARADFNGDGAIDFFDYLDFVDAFSIGC
jgi:hypothetical protein